MLKLVHDATADAVDDPETMTVDLDELCRVAAQDMLAVALLAERRVYLDAHADVTDATGKRMVVGNGYARERHVMTGAGMVDVQAPRVDDRRDGEKFTSALLPAYMRRSPKVTEVLPLLYLRGLSTGDFGPGKASDEGHQGRRLTRRRHGHGVQAARRRPGPLAAHQRPRARPARTGGRHLHRRQASREEKRHHQRRGNPVRRRLTKKPHPQLG
jgi:hypothetical protein